MSTNKSTACLNLLPDLEWRSLVNRSILSWTQLHFRAEAEHSPTLVEQMLTSYQSLDDFLDHEPSNCMFWFFQQRDTFLSQTRMQKWSPAHLDNYILLPAAPGFVSRRDCFFVSHYWRGDDHPDPDGEFLRLFQSCLAMQEWSYIWLDWSCMPQHPRSKTEQKYFDRSLATVSGLVRNCGFVYFYPPFEARLWILYEVAEYCLTASQTMAVTEDVREFEAHVREMVASSVRSVLEKYGYKCKNESDKVYLTSWLELLVLFKRLDIDCLTARRTLDHLTYNPTVHTVHMGPMLQVEIFRGRLTYHGETWDFMPFPRHRYN